MLFSGLELSMDFFIRLEKATCVSLAFTDPVTLAL